MMAEALFVRPSEVLQAGSSTTQAQAQASTSQVQVAGNPTTKALTGKAKGRACVDLTNAVSEFVDQVIVINPNMTMFINMINVIFQSRYQTDVWNHDQLSTFFCKFEGAKSAADIAAILGVSVGDVEEIFTPIKEVYKFIGGEQGVLHLIQSLMDIVDAVARMGILN